MIGVTCDCPFPQVSLLITILLMGISTTLIGCLPTYNHIGPAAPALLAVLRICMGLAVGAEYTTAIVYVHEAGRRSQKAIHSVLIAASCALGGIVGMSVVMIVNATTTQGVEAGRNIHDALLLWRLQVWR
jgi:MFS family permease